MSRLLLSRPPVREDVDVADDDPILIHDRRVESTAITAIATERLSEGVLPDHLPVGVQAE